MLALACEECDGFLDSGYGPQGGLDLSKFDTEAAQLDLMICAAEIVDGTRRVPAAEIARAVEASEGRMGDEALFCKFRLREIAVREAVAAEMQRACNARRDGLAVRVKDMRGGVGDGGADGDRLRRLREPP